MVAIWILRKAVVLARRSFAGIKIAVINQSSEILRQIISCNLVKIQWATCAPGKVQCVTYKNKPL